MDDPGVAAGILSYGQDIDDETLPFQCTLAYQVPRNKAVDYIGKARLEAVRAMIEAGRPPFKLTMVGMALGGRPITDYAPDFWLISGEDGGGPVGYVTSPRYAPELETNIALGFVPVVTGRGARCRVSGRATPKHCSPSSRPRRIRGSSAPPCAGAPATVPESATRASNAAAGSSEAAR